MRRSNSHLRRGFISAAISVLESEPTSTTSCLVGTEEPGNKRPRTGLGTVVTTGLNQLINLEVLDLSRNQLTGKGEIFLESNFRFRVCSPVTPCLDDSMHCTLGGIPASLGEPLNLSELNIGNNKLIGEEITCVRFLSSILAELKCSGDDPERLTTRVSYHRLPGCVKDSPVCTRNAHFELN